VSFRIDGSLYPDEPPPAVLQSLAERVDYLARLCSAWDFGILPDRVTLLEIRRRRRRIRTSSSCEEHVRDPARGRVLGPVTAA
jgi:hypothetical protein